MSQEPTPGTTDKDEQELRELIARLADSWAPGDAQAYGAEFTDDCDYVALDGTRFRGPTEPHAQLARLFDTVLKDTRLEGKLESVRFLTPEVAVVHWTGSVACPGSSRCSAAGNPGRRWWWCGATGAGRPPPSRTAGCARCPSTASLCAGDTVHPLARRTGTTHPR
jgi:uncharacterized protein (TIGR02246 family)